MIKEPVVFLGNNGIHHLLRDLVIGNREAVLDKNLAHLLAIAVQNDTCRLHFGNLRQIKGIRLRLEFRNKPTVDN